jgi:hypothetical protein
VSAMASDDPGRIATAASFQCLGRRVAHRADGSSG